MSRKACLVLIKRVCHDRSLVNFIEIVEKMQNNLILITTIIPTYRRPESLKRAIQSVLNQTYPHFQLCIYDDASGDATEEVIAEFAKDARVKYHCHSQTIGSAENFQYGLSKVHTPFFSFLSDDDFLLPEFYQTTLQGFEKFPESAFSMGAVIDIDQKGGIIDVVLSKWPDKDYFSPPNGLLEMIGKYSNWTGVLFRKEVIHKIGCLDLNLKAIDVDYLFRIAAHLPFTVSKKPVAVFVQHPSSFSGSVGLKLIWPGWQMMTSKINEDQNIPLNVRKQVEQMLREDLANLLMMNLMRSIAAHKLDEARTILNIFEQQASRVPLIRIFAILMCIFQAFPIAGRVVKILLQWLRKIKRASLQKRYKKLIKQCHL